MTCAALFLLWSLLCSDWAATNSHAEVVAERVTSGLQSLYTFERLETGVIPDRSGAAEPLPLRIDKPQNALFRGGRMIVTAPVTMTTDGSARRLSAAIKATNELTVEAWLKPLEVGQGGPARIVSLSVDPGHRNFTVGQDKSRYDFRVRTSKTDENGIPSTPGPENALTTQLTHVAFERAANGTVRLFVDGKLAASNTAAGDLSNWSDEFQLSVANEVTGDRPWLGDLHLVAIYNRALTEQEIQQNFRAGVPQAVNYAALLPPAHTGNVEFARDIQPILKRHCYECHSADQEDGGVNLGMRQRALQGGDNGPIFLAGDSANSRLVHLVAAIQPEEVMPPEGQRLTPSEIGLLRAWIDQGAVWPTGIDVPDPREELAHTHWAFQPLRSVDEPVPKNTVWSKSPIDRFVLARLETAGVTPQGPADARTLIRRITMDLTGLPPSPAEIEAFISAAASNRDEAIASLVDRLLASPHYGERWGRHWLDVARYADSDGQESDRDRPTAYRYRDFVIRSLNDDMSYDQFIRWQLAGDEYEPSNPEAIAATGFLAAGPFAALPDRLMKDELLRNRYNELDDMLSTIGTGFLGLTLGCVRCHDHKYDAIPARDYYSLMSAFHGGERAEVPIGPAKETVLAYRDLGAQPSATWLFQRGNYYDRDQPVTLGFVSILTRGKTADEFWSTAREQSPSQGSTNQRRALADWMTDVEHGAGALLARVIVNRVWMHHFGQGIVRTVGDFGVRSESPTHPELLEWLTHDFVVNGWKIKRLHRQIALSSVYQQSSTGSAPAADPDNRLFWKMPLRRLEGEILRDAMLSVSGTLNPATYGPAVKPPIAAEAIQARNLKDGYPDKIEDSPDLRRRSIYLFHKRVVPYPLLQAFDKPDAQQSCSRRDRTTVAPQALALMNDPFVRTVSSEFAALLIKDGGSDLAGRIRLGYQRALGRLPGDDELASAETFIAAQVQDRRERDKSLAEDVVQKQALADFCQVLFSLNEFLYID
jgi:hypothetical protein